MARWYASDNETEEERTEREWQIVYELNQKLWELRGHIENLESSTDSRIGIETLEDEMDRIRDEIREYGGTPDI